MNTSNNIPLELNCQDLGLKNFPIVGYPFNVYKENFEYPIYKRNVKRQFNSNPILVKKYDNIPYFEAPRYGLNYAQKNTPIPVFHKVPKIVEIPEIREITKFVDSVKVIDVPVEQVRMIPKLKIREIEKIRHVQGPIEYIDIPQEHIVHKPYTEVVEKIYEMPEIEDIEIEVPIYVPTPVGPPKDVHINVPLPYDVPQFCYKPDRSIPHRIPIPTPHNINTIPNIYFKNEIFNEQIPKVDFSKKNQKIMYSSLPMECDIQNKKNTYKNNIHCNMKYDMNENFNDNGEHHRNKLPYENIDYYKYNKNYGNISNSQNIPKNKNNVNSPEKNEKYFYSYSSYNKYNENNTRKNIHDNNHNNIDYANNYEDNKNYIYDDEFEDKNSYDNNFTTELIVQKKKN